MKNIIKISFLAAFLALGACNNSSNEGDGTKLIDSNKRPKITFAEQFWDFKNITEGEIVEHTFDFTNTGDGNLVISNVVASCGCTAPDWPKEPVKPGQKSSIKVKFNSTGKFADQSKDVTVQANTVPNETKITFKAFVNKKK